MILFSSSVSFSKIFSVKNSYKNKSENIRNVSNENIKSYCNKYKAFYSSFTLSLIASLFIVNFAECEGGSLFQASSQKIAERKKSDQTKNESETNEEQLSELFDDDFSLVDENNQKIAIDSLKNRVVVIVFSTTWCPNCPVVLKAFDNLQSKLQKNKITDDDIKIIALNIGDEGINEIKNHYKEYDITHLSVYQSISKKIDSIEGVPATLVFDKESKLIGKYLGWRDFASDSFINFLKEISNAKNTTHK